MSSDRDEEDDRKTSWWESFAFLDVLVWVGRGIWALIAGLWAVVTD